MSDRRAARAGVATVQHSMGDGAAGPDNWAARSAASGDAAEAAVEVRRRTPTTEADTQPAAAAALGGQWASMTAAAAGEFPVRFPRVRSATQTWNTTTVAGEGVG
jgi:hypothetical protein